MGLLIEIKVTVKQTDGKITVINQGMDLIDQTPEMMKIRGGNAFGLPDNFMFEVPNIEELKEFVRLLQGPFRCIQRFESIDVEITAPGDII